VTAVRMLVIPAEVHPCDHSFLEEIHTRDDSRVRRTFLMRSTEARHTESREWNRARVEVFPLRSSWRLLAGLGVYGFEARYLPHLLRITRRERPHVVFVRDLTFPFFLALLLRPWTKWKVMYQRSFPHEHGWFDPHRLAQYRSPWAYRTARALELRLLRWLLRSADAVIPISERMGEEMIAQGICRRDRMHVFGMGVTKHVLEVGPPPPRGPGSQLRLVYVGTLTLRRRIERLMEAVMIARERHGIDARLTVLGGTASEVQELSAVVARHSASAHVGVRGRIPRDQVYEVMASHHAGAIFIARDPRFVVASTTKLVESLAIGLPCVCTDAVAMHQEMSDRTGAIVMTDDTAEGFAAGIARLDSRWDEFSTRASSARAPVFEEFSYERARDRLETIVLDLVGQSATER
jgi:glycosyltransferase involved in cell wall biosynthesis